MIRKLLRIAGLFCIATVLTQLVLSIYFAGRGTLSGETATQTVALLNGIDITGNRLQEIMRRSEDREQPDFEEILQARKLDSYDLDLRRQSQQMFADELTLMLAELRQDRDRLDQRLTSFRRELSEIRQDALNQGLRDAGRAIQVLDPEAAKDQLLIMFDEERKDDVVTIVQAMTQDKRRDILAEFQSEPEKEVLAELLRLISEGRPTTSLIDQANDRP